MKIGIIGLGLMGGSLALALKKYKQDITIYGYDTNQKHLIYAKEKKLIDHTLLEDNLQNVSIIFVATPVCSIVKVIADLYNIIDLDNTIVTDMGSSKKFICQEIKQRFPLLRFVGGHPMTGREVSGPEAALADLFRDKTYILINNNNPGDLAQIAEIIKGIRSKVITLNPEKHDNLISFTSHLPQFLATAVVNLLNDVVGENPEVIDLIGQGFLDFTRIAGSDPQMWTDILISNKKAVLRSIARLKGKIAEFEEAIKIEDEEYIYELIKKGREQRKKIEV
ncbi:prephenate dehydrogenase/arogenate dehydrogenase family protein [Halocella sp. SP3-1]|uniref:prephenate dehydrogenase n=1 Tax=Halocella sp. SP3-1 TaxID=2382161 RepID=UPI000F7576E7|nr:prephenate dehydrogenase/arogenate dehydrogenase family protein [Halocella sp. SP3-1]AZO95345.1 prephenate dehydrogenase/arogenate dehydrogenase family protein [Halocella sp. SP3-1]